MLRRRPGRYVLADDDNVLIAHDGFLRPGPEQDPVRIGVVYFVSDLPFGDMSARGNGSRQTHGRFAGIEKAVLLAADEDLIVQVKIDSQGAAGKRPFLVGIACLIKIAVIFDHGG